MAGPPDGGNYPPGNQPPPPNYPPQNYPPPPQYPPGNQQPQNYPPPQYPQGNYPPVGYPPQGYPQAGYPFAGMPSNNMALAIIALLIFPIPGIPALISANQVQTKWLMGDHAGAFESSRQARLYGLIGVVGGAVLWVLCILIYVILLATKVIVLPRS